MLQRCKSSEEASTLSKGTIFCLFESRLSVAFFYISIFIACQDLLMEIEKSKKPFVAAIMGSCLGGGLEVCSSFSLMLFTNMFSAELSYNGVCR